MKKAYILLFLIVTINGFSQNFNLDIKKIILFPKSEIANIEEYLTLKNWTLKDIKYENQPKFLSMKEINWRVFIFSYFNRFEEELATIEISIYDNNEENQISYKTSESTIYKEIIIELRKNNFKIESSGIGYISFPEDYKIGKTIIGNSFAKNYKNVKNKKIILYTNKYIKITDYDSSSDKFSYENIKTEYELAI